MLNIFMLLNIIITILLEILIKMFMWILSCAINTKLVILKLRLIHFNRINILLLIYKIIVVNLKVLRLLLLLWMIMYLR